MGCMTPVLKGTWQSLRKEAQSRKKSSVSWGLILLKSSEIFPVTSGGWILREGVLCVCPHVWGWWCGGSESLPGGALWAHCSYMLCKKPESPYFLEFSITEITHLSSLYTLSYRPHGRETLTCPLGILILVGVEIVSGTLSKVFVHRVTADSSDRLSDTSHFCWSLG